MFKLDMDAIRKSADVGWLMANSANPANEDTGRPLKAAEHPEISQPPAGLATLAKIAISQQVSHESAELLTARLIASAMRACDHHRDGEKARTEMRADCLATPLHQQAALLAYFREQYGRRS